MNTSIMSEDMLDIAASDQSEDDASELSSRKSSIEQPLYYAKTFSILGSAAMNEQRDWSVVLATGIMGYSLGLVVQTQTKKPHTIVISHGHREALAKAAYPFTVAPAVYVAKAVYGEAITAEQLSTCVNARVFPGGVEVLVTQRDLDKILPSCTSVSLSTANLDGFKFESSAILQAFLLEGEAWSKRARLRAVKASAVFSLVSLLLRFLWKRHRSKVQVSTKLPNAQSLELD
jgi:hypothetical protein